MPAPKIFPVDLRPNSGSAWWYDWHQDRTLSAAGTSKVADAGRGLWRSRLVFNLRKDSNARRVHAFLLGLHGWIEPFRIGIPYDDTERLGFATGGLKCTVSGTVGYNIPTSPWTPANGTVMLAGQFISMSTVTEEPRLQMLVEDAVAVGGVATLKVSPGVQIPTRVNEAVHINHYSALSGIPARATMVLTDPDGVERQFSHPVWSDIEVELEEWWPDRDGV